MFEKQIWTKSDIDEFYKHLQSLKNQERIEWTRKIINTNLPLLAIKAPKLKEIAKQILKGNYISFLEQKPFKFYESIAICGLLITKINDFNNMTKFLFDYTKVVDNWALCDLLKFNIKSNEQKFMALVTKLLHSNLVFERRIGIIILFEFLQYPNYISNIFKFLSELKQENEYYVNMASAWLVCELFVKQRDLTLDFLKSNALNDFVVNKAVAKCRDSYRVSEQDKQLLLQFKR